MPASIVDATQNLEAETKFVIKQVGVVGLGHMGHAFAANLVRGGYQVLGYDRDPSRSVTLTGVSDAARLEDLATCDVVLTSLPDDDAHPAVGLGPAGFAALPSRRAGAIYTSTV